jgi:hypothetical protein
MEAAQLAQRKALKCQWNPKFQRSSHNSPDDLDMNVRYYISKSRNHPVDIWSFLRSNKTDPSSKVFSLSNDHVYSTSHVCNPQGFLPKLQDHILGRLLERPSQGDTYGDFSDAERNTVHILGNKLFKVSTMTVNYTSYDIDIRRDYDLVNPRSHPDIMVVSPDSETNDISPFWYARVLKIFHADVWTSHPDVCDKSIHRMNILWVRWFGSEPGYNWGFSRARLPKIGFVEWNDPFAFTFLDPAHVVRGCHLIPAFAEGRTSMLLPEGKSAARVLVAEETDDWLNFYVGMCVTTRVTICHGNDTDCQWLYSFADRDLMIRHYGGGIGHLQDVYSVDHEQNDMMPVVQEDSGDAEDGIRPTGKSNVAVESDSESGTDDCDMGFGSERGDDDFSEDEESDGYATP